MRARNVFKTVKRSFGRRNKLRREEDAASDDDDDDESSTLHSERSSKLSNDFPSESSVSAQESSEGSTLSGQERFFEDDVDDDGGSDSDNDENVDESVIETVEEENLDTVDDEDIEVESSSSQVANKDAKDPVTTSSTSIGESSVARRSHDDDDYDDDDDEESSTFTGENDDEDSATFESGQDFDDEDDFSSLEDTRDDYDDCTTRSSGHDQRRRPLKKASKNRPSVANGNRKQKAKPSLFPTFRRRHSGGNGGGSKTIDASKRTKGAPGPRPHRRGLFGRGVAANRKILHHSSIDGTDVSESKDAKSSSVRSQKVVNDERNDDSADGDLVDQENVDPTFDMTSAIPSRSRRIAVQTTRMPPQPTRESIDTEDANKAAESLGKDLEEMGYNLNCESFLTKGSTDTKPFKERYDAVDQGHDAPKTEPKELSPHSLGSFSIANRDRYELPSIGSDMTRRRESVDVSKLSPDVIGEILQELTSMSPKSSREVILGNSNTSQSIAPAISSGEVPTPIGLTKSACNDENDITVTNSNELGSIQSLANRCNVPTTGSRRGESSEKALHHHTESIAAVISNLDEKVEDAHADWLSPPMVDDREVELPVDPKAPADYCLNVKGTISGKALTDRKLVGDSTKQLPQEHQRQSDSFYLSPFAALAEVVSLDFFGFQNQTLQAAPSEESNATGPHIPSQYVQKNTENTRGRKGKDDAAVLNKKEAEDLDAIVTKVSSSLSVIKDQLSRKIPSSTAGGIGITPEDVAKLRFSRTRHIPPPSKLNVHQSFESDSLFDDVLPRFNNRENSKRMQAISQPPVLRSIRGRSDVPVSSRGAGNDQSSTPNGLFEKYADDLLPNDGGRFKNKPWDDTTYNNAPHISIISKEEPKPSKLQSDIQSRNKASYTSNIRGKKAVRWHSGKETQTKVPDFKLRGRHSRKLGRDRATLADGIEIPSQWDSLLSPDKEPASSTPGKPPVSILRKLFDRHNVADSSSSEKKNNMQKQKKNLLTSRVITSNDSKKGTKAVTQIVTEQHHLQATNSIVQEDQIPSISHDVDKERDESRNSGFQRGKSIAFLRNGAASHENNSMIESTQSNVGELAVAVGWCCPTCPAENSPSTKNSLIERSVQAGEVAKAMDKRSISTSQDPIPPHERKLLVPLSPHDSCAANTIQPRIEVTVQSQKLPEKKRSLISRFKKKKLNSIHNKRVDITIEHPGFDEKKVRNELTEKQINHDKAELAEEQCSIVYGSIEVPLAENSETCVPLVHESEGRQRECDGASRKSSFLNEDARVGRTGEEIMTLVPFELLLRMISDEYVSREQKLAWFYEEIRKQHPNLDCAPIVIKQPCPMSENIAYPEDWKRAQKRDIDIDSKNLDNSNSVTHENSRSRGDGRSEFKIHKNIKTTAKTSVHDSLNRGNLIGSPDGNFSDFGALADALTSLSAVEAKTQSLSGMPDGKKETLLDSIESAGNDSKFPNEMQLDNPMKCSVPVPLHLLGKLMWCGSREEMEEIIECQLQDGNVTAIQKGIPFVPLMRAYSMLNEQRVAHINFTTTGEVEVSLTEQDIIVDNGSEIPSSLSQSMQIVSILDGQSKVEMVKRTSNAGPIELNASSAADCRETGSAHQNNIFANHNRGTSEILADIGAADARSREQTAKQVSKDIFSDKGYSDDAIEVLKSLSASEGKNTFRSSRNNDRLWAEAPQVKVNDGSASGAEEPRSASHVNKKISTPCSNMKSKSSNSVHFSDDGEDDITPSTRHAHSNLLTIEQKMIKTAAQEIPWKVQTNRSKDSMKSIQKTVRGNNQNNDFKQFDVAEYSSRMQGILNTNDQPSLRLSSEKGSPYHFQPPLNEFGEPDSSFPSQFIVNLDADNDASTLTSNNSRKHHEEMSTIDSLGIGLAAWNEIYEASKVVEGALKRFDDERSDEDILIRRDGGKSEVSVAHSIEDVDKVEKALETLKKHAQRLGVKESDLLLAVKTDEEEEEEFNEATEVEEVRSLTLGEEILAAARMYGFFGANKK